MVYSKTGAKAGVKQSQLWTDSILIGGSDPLQATGSVMIIEVSGTNAGTPTISGGKAYFADVMVNTYYPVWGSTGSTTPDKNQLLIQAGSGTTGGGSTAWQAFPTAYSKAPLVKLEALGVTADEGTGIGSIAAGSFEAYTATASTAFQWFAVGEA